MTIFDFLHWTLTHFWPFVGLTVLLLITGNACIGIATAIASVFQRRS